MSSGLGEAAKETCGWPLMGSRRRKRTSASAQKSREAVREFYEAALAAGGTDNGPPGIREVYHPAYYAAFVLDPEGHNIEAVTFEP